MPSNSCCAAKKTEDLGNNDITIKDAVRKAYAEVAVKNSTGEESGNPVSCCGAPKEVDVAYCKQLGYTEDDLKEMVDGANMGLGCGNPTAIAALKEGEIVLDLGSGGGFDCFLAARRVGKTGRVIGVDMTPEMLQKARKNAQKGNHTNVEFRLGEIEHLPVGDNTVDVVISNCVLNLSTDKPQVIREAYRVLKPGGRLAISDIVATKEMPEEVKKNLDLYSGCMAGATPINTLKQSLDDAGFINVAIKVKEASKQFIQKWSYDFEAENYVASATIEAVKADYIIEHIKRIKRHSECSD